MKKLSRFILGSLTFVNFLLPAEARWATPDEAPVEYEYYNRDITADGEGKSEEIIEQSVKILNEVGRDTYGTQRMTYNSNIEEIKIIEAKVIHQDKEYKVPPSTIEKKPLASSISGFDQINQILISYPKVSIGSTIYLKYKVTTRQQPLPKYYSNSFNFGREGNWKKARVTIKSKFPLHFLHNDPHESLSVKEEKTKGTHSFEITLKKPLYTATRHEPHGSFTPEHKGTWVMVSSMNSFPDMGREFSKGFLPVLDQPLPPLFEEIKAEAAKLQTAQDQINKVTSLLSERIRYMGDWRSIQGRFAPRNLSTIAQSGVGDCKDFSTVTAAILKHLGFKTHVALVMRGAGYEPPKHTFSVPDAFNHAMTKIIDKDGKIYWIDPTNQSSMADGIFPDIANRPALVLEGDKSSYEMISDIDYNRSRYQIQSTVTLKAGDILATEGLGKLQGEQALLLTGAALNTSKQSIEEMIIHGLSGEATPVSKSVELPDLTSRIRSDLEIKFSYEQKNAVLFTNVGNGIYLDAYWVNPYMELDDTIVGTCYMGMPRTVLKKITLKSVKVSDVDALNFSISSPWLDSKRTCEAKEEGVEITHETIIKKSFISAEEAKSDEYKQLKDNLKKYCTRVALIFAQKG